MTSHGRFSKANVLMARKLGVSPPVGRMRAIVVLYTLSFRQSPTSVLARTGCFATMQFRAYPIQPSDLLAALIVAVMSSACAVKCSILNKQHVRSRVCRVAGIAHQPYRCVKAVHPPVHRPNFTVINPALLRNRKRLAGPQTVDL